MTTIRKLPEADPRVETGPVQFGDDWPGTFIRGDNAFGYAMALRGVLDAIPPGSATLNHIVLAGLVDDLGSCNLHLRETSDHIKSLLKDFATNWDCDTGANGTHPSYCRACAAKAALAKL